MANSETFTTRIFLNDAQAKATISKLQAKIEDLRQSMEQAAAAGNGKQFNKLKAELNATTKQLNSMRTSAQKVSSVLDNLSGASVKDIRDTIKAINKELTSGAVERGSDKWKFLTDSLQKCNAELKKIKQESAEAKGFGDFLDQLGKLNQIGFLFTNLIGIGGGISSLSDTVRSAVNDFAAMDEQMANTRKYTGMTAEEVKALNDDFKKMDTRTSREALNDLAGAAGRLGITSKQAVEEFVDAADKINVALGDDLGEGAVDQVGKLAMAFGEDDRMGLRAAMLATGSTVNELAQNSAANAGYLVDFTARVAGVAKQVGLSQAQIMGFAAVMDENLLQDEMASTAFSQMMTKMQTDTAKFAKFAGMDVKSFTNLVKTDFNGAILALADNLKKQDPSNMMKMLTDMGLSGTRAVSVLSNLADKIDDVRKMQKIATDAYQNGTSVIDEFNTMNSTAQAQLDKAKKNFHELSIELGEQLRPATTAMLSVLGGVVSVLSTLIGFTTRHIGTIIRLTAAYAAVRIIINASNIALKAHYAWLVITEKATKAWTLVTGYLRSALTATRLVYILLTQGTKAYTAAMEEAKAASMTNPWTALATVLLTVGVAVYELVKHFQNESEEAARAAEATSLFQKNQQNMRDVTEQAHQQVSEEAARLKTLYGILKDSNASYDDRKRALEEIKKIVPDYHGSLTREGRLINDNSQSLADYCNNLIKAAKAQAAFDKIAKLQGNTMNHQTLLRGRQSNQQWVVGKLNELGFDPEKDMLLYENNGRNAYILRGGTQKKTYIDVDAAQSIQRYVNDYNYNKKRIAEETSVIDSNQKQSETLAKMVGIDTVTKDGDKSSNGSKGGGSGSTDDYQTDAERRKAESERKKRQKEAEKARREAEKKEVDAAKKHTDELQAANTLAYMQGEIDYRQYQSKRHEIAIDGLKTLEAVYKKYGDDSTQQQADLARQQQQIQQEQSKQRVSDLEDEYRLEQIRIKEQLYDSTSPLYKNEEAVNEALFRAEIDFLEKKKAAQIDGSEEQADTETQIQEKLEQHKLELAQRYAERLKQYREQWGRKDSKTQEKIALDGLEDLHKKGLIKEEEYQRMKKAIGLHYEVRKSEEDLQNSAGEVFKRNVSDVYTDASNEAKASYENDHPKGESVIDYFTSDFKIFAGTMANIKQMEKDGVISHEEAMAAMGKATGSLAEEMAAKMQWCYEKVSPLMNALSSYYSAQCDYEVAVTEKKYEKLINAASGNSARQKKLQEKQEKETAAIKTKYARRQAAMQIAQAVAESAISALSAYASVMKGVPYPANMVLAPIAAGLALAAGAIQIATIKKQQQAQEAGYYEGGYTGGRRYREEAGVVHQGEFVANHRAVANQQLRPALDLIDQAQRNNTVGSLTAADVSRAMGTAGATVVSAPSVTVNTDNAELNATLRQTRDTIDRLSTLLQGGIEARMPDWSEFDRSRSHWERLQSRR